MLTEQREIEEHEAPDDLIRDLKQYIRQDVNKQALDNEHVAASLEGQLARKAKQWCMTHGYKMNDRNLQQLSSNIVLETINNYKNDPGKDNRGKARLGCINKNLLG